MKRRKFFKTAVIGAGAIALAPTLAIGQDPLASIRQYYYNWYIAPRDYNVHVPYNNYWRLLSECVKSKPTWNDCAKAIDPPQFPYPVYTKTHVVNFHDYDNVYQYRNYRNHIFWMNVEDYVFYEELERDAVFNYSQTHLLFAGYIPGIMNPVCPLSKAIRPVDCYELVIIYQRNKLW